VKPAWVKDFEDSKPLSFLGPLAALAVLLVVLSVTLWLFSGCAASPTPGPQPGSLGAYELELQKCVANTGNWSSYDQCTEAAGRKFGFYDAGVPNG
jgi:hypothetical protein